jgi:hypothetical protein
MRKLSIFILFHLAIGTHLPVPSGSEGKHHGEAEYSGQSITYCIHRFELILVSFKIHWSSSYFPISSVEMEKGNLD